MNLAEHYTKVGIYYNTTTQAWIDTYRRTQSFRFHQFLDEHDNILYKKIFKKPGSYLDAGCGDFSFSLKASKNNKNINITGVTLSQKQVDIAASKCTDRCIISLQNFENLDFRDNSFDGCYFIESFSHALNKEKVCKEIRRVVKPGGHIYILDLNLHSKAKKDKTYWGWYNIFFFLPIKYRQSLQLFERFFLIDKTTTNLRNYRKDLYRKIRPNINFEDCECTFLDKKTLTEYGKYHTQQSKYNLPVVWSEFIMVNRK
ncbi:MAG: class I SAM-dependent methyltransferase [Proteobacteria bacterium]|nr:class I SAM-dependent methyltransferase [Pseudomonadota bacterium]NBP13095.1 class I SAM-dependent methyltransferase [bacterium]